VHRVTTPPAGSGLLVIERILRDRAGIWQQIVEERQLRPLIGQMLASSAISLALYGAVLGASYGWEQILSSLIKLPLLFLATLAICLPTLYLFNLVFGARLSMVQAVALIMVSITVTAVLTLAFAPVSLFFLVTAQSYSFYKLLNVAILLLTAVIGLRFLVEGMRTLNERRSIAPTPVPAQQIPAAPAAVSNGAAANGAANGAVAASEGATAPAGEAAPVGSVAPAATAAPVATATLPPAVAPQPQPLYLPARPMNPHYAARQPTAERPASMGLLYIWIVLFGFVGTQLAWTLRPFFGDPGQPFGVFREVGGTFYADVLRTLGDLLGG
jgi:hypothetical protein